MTSLQNLPPEFFFYMKDSLSPILNNPYEEPRLHYDADFNGNLDYTKVLNGRRPYSAHIGIVPNRPDSALFSLEAMPDDHLNQPVIHLIRDDLNTWRLAGHPNAIKRPRSLLTLLFDNQI